MIEWKGLRFWRYFKALLKLRKKLSDSAVSMTLPVLCLIYYRGHFIIIGRYVRSNIPFPKLTYERVIPFPKLTYSRVIPFLKLPFNRVILFPKLTYDRVIPFPKLKCNLVAWSLFLNLRTCCGMVQFPRSQVYPSLHWQAPALLLTFLFDSARPLLLLLLLMLLLPVLIGVVELLLLLLKLLL